MSEPRRGYGYACLNGIEHALKSSFDVITFLDGDLSDYPEELSERLYSFPAYEAKGVREYWIMQWCEERDGEIAYPRGICCEPYRVVRRIVEANVFSTGRSLFGDFGRVLFHFGVTPYLVRSTAFGTKR